MKKKSVHATTHELDENWQLLANAICIQAVHDFETLISDKPAIDGNSRYCNLTEIRQFAKEQIYSNVNLDTVLDIVEKNFKSGFKPYVTEHGEEIEKNWKRQHLDKKARSEKLARHPYLCPNCHGILYPSKFKVNKTSFILCDGCNLNAKIVKGGGKPCSISA